MTAGSGMLAAGVADIPSSVWVGFAAIAAAVALLGSSLLRRPKAGQGSVAKGARVDAAGPAIQRANSAQTANPARGSASSQASGAPAESDLRQLMAELEDVSRRVSGQIDARLRKLEATLADADGRIAELRALVDAQQRPTVDAAAAPAPPQVQLFVTNPPPAPPAGARPAPEPVAAAMRRAAGDAADRREAIFQLADQGIAAPEIAQRVGRSIGEVELMLNLRQAG